MDRLEFSQGPVKTGIIGCEACRLSLEAEQWQWQAEAKSASANSGMPSLSLTHVRVGTGVVTLCNLISPIVNESGKVCRRESHDTTPEPEPEKDFNLSHSTLMVLQETMLLMVLQETMLRVKRFYLLYFPHTQWRQA